MARTRDTAKLLADVALFSRCTDGDLRTIARHLESVEVPADTPIVTEGEDGETFYLLLDGTATVSRDGERVRELGPGSYFGELALLDPHPRAATVTTTTTCHIAILSARMFRVIVRDLPTVSFGLLGSMAEQLREALA